MNTNFIDKNSVLPESISWRSSGRGRITRANSVAQSSGDSMMPAYSDIDRDVGTIHELSGSVTPAVFAYSESTPLKGGGSALPWQSRLALTPSEILRPEAAGLRMTANYPQHINAGTSGDCATYHIKDVIKFPSNNQPDIGLAGRGVPKELLWRIRPKGEDGVCKSVRSGLARLDGIAGQALTPSSSELPEQRMTNSKYSIT